MFLLDMTVPTDFGGLFNVVVDAAKGGHWSIFASALVMLLVFLVEKMPFVSDKIKGEKKVWVAACCGVLMAVATTAFTTGDWVKAVFDGLSIGLSATGLFELVKRKINKKPIDANNDGVLDQ
jgi:hypothetical protein